MSSGACHIRRHGDTRDREVASNGRLARPPSRKPGYEGSNGSK